MLVPFVGAFTVGLILAIVCGVTSPALNLYCKSGEYVEVGFAWVTIHSSRVYFVYWLIFTTVSFGVLVIRSLLKRFSVKDSG
jgi:hypothetical protein